MGSSRIEIRLNEAKEGDILEVTTESGSLYTIRVTSRTHGNDHLTGGLVIIKTKGEDLASYGNDAIVNSRIRIGGRMVIQRGAGAREEHDETSRIIAILFNDEPL
jgi:hypothetical protein